VDDKQDATHIVPFCRVPLQVGASESSTMIGYKSNVHPVVSILHA
jgi:hypothetical protein